MPANVHVSLAERTQGLWVSAYYAGWYWDSEGTAQAALDAVDMSNMTHFIFGRYAPGGDAGGLGGTAGDVIEAAGTGHAQVEQDLIDKAHTAGIKALAMLGGAGDSVAWEASTADQSTRDTFCTNIVDMCVAHDYDGVDVDWEENLTASSALIIAFLGDLRTEAQTRARYQSPNDPFIITFPAFTKNTNIDSVAPWEVTVSTLVDQMNLMSYGQNYWGAGWESWFFMPLTGHASTYPVDIASSVQMYVDAGVVRSKMGMGIGLYGSYYMGTTTGPRQTIDGFGGGDDNWDTWENFYTKGLLDHADGTYVFDEAAGVGYYSYSPAASYQKAGWAEVEYLNMLTTADPTTIASLGAWAKAGNCGGTIVWTINNGFVTSLDTNPPMNQIGTAFL